MTTSRISIFFYFTAEFDVSMRVCPIVRPALAGQDGRAPASRGPALVPRSAQCFS